MTGTKPEVVQKGTDIIMASNVEVAVTNVQTVATHGHAAVTDAGVLTNVQHYPGKTTITPYNFASGKKGCVHVPIHNPIATVQDPAKLQNILVTVGALSTAKIEGVGLYYGLTEVKTFNAGGKTETFHIDFTATEASDYSYTIGEGISVQLDLSFPKSDSHLDLLSVILVYKME